MANGAVLAQGRQDGASITCAKAEPPQRHALSKPVLSHISRQAVVDFASDPSFESVVKRLEWPRHHDYLPDFVFTGGCWRVMAVLPYAFSKKASVFGKDEKYKELVGGFSKSAEFRERFEKDLKEYFSCEEHGVDWLDSVLVEWGAKGSAPLIMLLPERSAKMYDIGGEYLSHNAYTDEQLNVLMACTCIFLRRLYVALDEREALFDVKRLLGKKEVRKAEGDVTHIDLRNGKRE